MAETALVVQSNLAPNVPASLKPPKTSNHFSSPLNWTYTFANIDSRRCARDHDEVLRLGGDAEDLLIAALGFLEVRTRRESRENPRIEQLEPGVQLDEPGAAQLAAGGQ